MTIVIAACYRDGVMMASDSQSTEETGGIRYDVPKVFQLTDRAMWGGSGSGQIIREVRQVLEANRAALEATDTPGQVLVGLVRPVLALHYQNFMQVPALVPASPATSILAAGWTTNNEPWIVEVDPRCQYTHYEDGRGFHAIGSGAGFGQLAHSLLAHFEVAEHGLEYGRMVVFRAIAAAIETSASGVGGPVQLWIADRDGVRKIENGERDELAASVGGWQEAERNTLEELLSVQEQEPSEMPSETPAPPGEGAAEESAAGDFATEPGDGA
jgi:20S proteasome alpha/beta subunit